MKPFFAFWLCCLIYSDAAAGQDEAQGKATAAAKAVLLQEIRERIIWYDEEKTSPLFIPKAVFGLIDFEELPIPEGDREGIRMWISFRKDWRSPAGEPYPECTVPQVHYRSIGGDEPITIEQAAAEGPVSLLVTIEKTTEGYRPSGEGMARFNDISVLEVLTGSEFPFQNPRATSAFLSEGGEMIVEGTKLCTISRWHTVAPRAGDTYLLVGWPDKNGLFYPNYYFRVENGMIAPAGYSNLKQSKELVPLARVKASLPKSRDLQ
jgi:hypothetical protein